MAQIDHDSGKWEENTGFEPIPAGEYKAVIVDSELKPTKDGQRRITDEGKRLEEVDHYLKIELQIVEGKYENRKLWDNLNLRNTSEMAVKIARGTLSSIVKACNKSSVKDSMELHGIPMTIKVAIEKRTDTGEDQNKIKSYKAAGAAAPTLSQTSSAPPWTKK